jgi:pilus assembly protein Flp/PilA
MFITIKLVAAAMMARLSEHFGIESQKGVTIIEYALLGALIAAALVASLTGLKDNLITAFTTIGSSL